MSLTRENCCPGALVPSSLDFKMTHKTKSKVQIHIYRRTPDSGEVTFLVLKRSDRKNSIWQPVTGNVDEGEALQACALREVEEETGLTDLLALRKVYYFEYDRGQTVFQETVFAAESPAGAVRISDEHVDFCWASYEKARGLIHHESNQLALDEAHKLLSGVLTQDEEETEP